MRLLKIGCLSLLILLTAGCGQEDMSDLEEFVAAEKRKQPPPVGGLPKFPRPNFHQYIAYNKRDPFLPLEEAKKKRLIPKEEPKKRLDCRIPDSNRTREKLEEFPLDTLEMVGTLIQGDEFWALVEGPSPKDGGRYIYRVTYDNHMGQDFGRVISVTENEIELVELHSDDKGCYEEKAKVLTLKVAKGASK